MASKAVQDLTKAFAQIVHTETAQASAIEAAKAALDAIEGVAHRYAVEDFNLQGLPDALWNCVTVDANALLQRPKGKGGRPGDEDYDRAFQMIKDGGFTEAAYNEARAWWYERTGKTAGGRRPTRNDNKSFGDAMTRRTRKRTGT